MKCEVQKYQEMLESREALISATGFALDHVIEQARFELEAHLGVVPHPGGKQENNSSAFDASQQAAILAQSYTLQTLLNIRSQLAQIN